MMKHTKFRVLTAGLLIAAILTGLVGTGPKVAVSADDEAVAAYEAKLQAATELLAQYEAEKQQAEELIAQFSEQMADIETYITELDLQMNDITLRLYELQQEIEDTEAELEDTRQELEAAKVRKEEQYETMKARVRYIYEEGETSYLDVLMNASSIGDLLNQLEYVSSIQAYDNSLLEAYEEARQEVEDREAYLEASLEELRLMEEKAELEQSTVDELIELKAAEIENLSEQLGIADEYLFTYISEISSQEMTIDEIIKEEEERVAEEERKRKEEEARIAAEQAAAAAAAKAAAEAAAAAAANNKSKSYDPDAINSVVLTEETDPYKMIWPLPGDHRTYSKFGYRVAPLPGASTYHKGWDIGGVLGAPIVAVLAGTVLAVGYNSSGGYYVRIEHEDGMVSVYCHCSKQLVTEGEHVMQGQTIALVGSTGVSTGPHLHFGIMVNGTYIDPEPYIGPLE